MFRLNPVTRKRLRRFREKKRAFWSFRILLLLYVLSLGSELICNDKPLYVRFNGRSYFPVIKFYPEDTFTGSGQFTRPDYKAVRATPAFRNNPDNFMIFPPVPYGPNEIIDQESLRLRQEVTVEMRPEPMLGSINVDEALRVVRSTASRGFFGKKAERDLRGVRLEDYFELPEALRRGLQQRFQNRAAEPLAAEVRSTRGRGRVIMRLPAYRPRSRRPSSVRITLKEKGRAGLETHRVRFERGLETVRDPGGVLEKLDASSRRALLDRAAARFEGDVEPLALVLGGVTYRARFLKEDVHFPFRPFGDHWMGVDSAGRDVFARILYGLRTSLTFGLILVACSIVIGIAVGAVQGYLGGAVDIVCQRLIEIWSALPFLYIMILMGSVYGRSFGLLIFIYGLFNWIGMSYYMRAEFLRLRKQTFVETAKCLGLPAGKIIFRHILPNGLVPVITFFPFSLVGAVGALAALDYLGFGLPPPTPSWGELLQQAQQFRWAWWLILYPSLALFTVMLLGVFIGEGVRDAYDPRPFSRME